MPKKPFLRYISTVNVVLAALFADSPFTYTLF